MSKQIRRMSKQMGSHAWKSLMKSAPETAAERDRLKALNAELLAALKNITGRYLLMSDSSFVWNAEDAKVVGASRAAIAKAEGKDD